MATTKKITEVQALEISFAIACGATVEDACNDAGFTVEEYRDKIERMKDTRAKKREKDPNAPKTKSKDRIQNEALAREVVDAMAKSGDEFVTSKWIMEHVNFITSTQKVTSVMQVANELGLAVKGDKIKGVITYRLMREGETPDEVTDDE